MITNRGFVKYWGLPQFHCWVLGNNTLLGSYSACLSYGSGRKCGRHGGLVLGYHLLHGENITSPAEQVMLSDAFIGELTKTFLSGWLPRNPPVPTLPEDLPRDQGTPTGFPKPRLRTIFTASYACLCRPIDLVFCFGKHRADTSE